MAEQYLFFNSTATDRRRHQASDMADYWQSFLSTGLINEGKHLGLQVTANNDMTITIKTGRGLIFGHLYRNTTDLVKTLEGAHPTLNRIDRIILRYDNTINSRFIKAFVLKGEPSENPVPPTLTREGYIYELSLAQINVVAGKSFIEQSDIIDERLDETVCGLATALGHVPTDVFKAQWEEFVAEYNQWFADLQGSSFATVEDVRAVDNDSKREVANLNLQLEAAQRVPQGKTYGTNFATTFGMAIDTARTSCDSELPIGTIDITVQDASGFVEGTEVTIYDDVNLERIKIASINGNIITLERATTKAFKEGVNVSRTMAVKNGVFPNMKFGVWGTYEKKNYNMMPTTTDIGVTNLSGSINNKIQRHGDSWYIIVAVGNTYRLLRLQDGTTMWTNVLYQGSVSFINKVSSNDTMSITSNGRYLFILCYSSNISFTIFTVKDGVFINRQDFDTAVAPYYISSNYVPEIDLLVTVYGTATGPSNRRIRAFSINSDGTVKQHGLEMSITSSNQSNSSNIIASKNIANDLQYVYVEDLLKIVSITSVAGQSSSTVSYELVTINPNFESLEVGPIFEQHYTGESSSTPFVAMNVIDGNIVIINPSYSSNNNYKGWKMTSSDLGITWTKSVFNGPERSYGVFLTREGIVYSVGSYRLHKASITDGVYEKIIDYGSPLIRGIANMVYDESTTIPFMVTDTFIDGIGELGYGSEININDIRFKVSPTKEAALWIIHNDDLSVSEAKFGTLPMVKETVTGETQFTAFSAVDTHDEIRFTITRDSVNDDVKINKILGGIG